MENQINLDCEFITPLYWDNSDETMKPVDGTLKAIENWNFSEMVCSGSTGNEEFNETFELIENADTGSNFYLNKSINYGDLLISFFLILFVVFGIFKFFVDFLFPKFMNFKRF